MKTANLEQELVNLGVKGTVFLPNKGCFSVKEICWLIERFCPQNKMGIRAIQKAIQACEAPVLQKEGNRPYYSRLYVKAALIYLKFEVTEDVGTING